MTVKDRDPVVRVFDKARRRIRADAALHMTAWGLWLITGAAWAVWLVHRYVNALPGWLIGAVAVVGVLIAALVIGLRLPTERQTLLRTDRAVEARSLLVCAMEAPSPRRAPAATVRRINCDAVAMAPRWHAALKTSLPVTWPMHGSVALLTLATAAMLLTLPGAAPDASASPTAVAVARSTREDTFARQARELARALTTGLERPTDTSPATDTTRLAQSTGPVATDGAGPFVDATRTESDSPKTALSTPAATVAGRNGGPGGGRSASDAAAGRLAGASDSDPLRTNAFQPILRRGASVTVDAHIDAHIDAYVHPPLGTAYDPAAAGAEMQNQAGGPPGARYLPPAMRHYLARYDRIRQETER